MELSGEQKAQLRAEVAKESLLQARVRAGIVSEFIITAIRSLIIVHGGAIVALLTFAKSSSASIKAQPAWLALALFALGLTATLLATLLFYRSQELIAGAEVEGGENRVRALTGEIPTTHTACYAHRGNGLKWWGVGFVAVSLVTFVAGGAAAIWHALLSS
ncbi:MAG: hypothetical protein QM608_14665 [Caulobacter sp.]